MDHDEQLSFSVRLKICPVEREQNLGILPGPANTEMFSRSFFSRFFAAPKAYKPGRLPDGYFTSQKWSWTRVKNTHFNCSGHKWQLCIDQYSLRYFLIITEYLNKIRIKSWVHDIEECSSPASARGSHTLHYTVLFRQCESFGSLALVCWQISCSIQWLRERQVAALRTYALTTN